MSASKRAFEAYAVKWCDYENIDRSHNGYHSYPTWKQLRDLYTKGVVFNLRNAVLLQKFNDGEVKCLLFGDIEGMKGTQIGTCFPCHQGNPCETGSEEE